MFKALERLLPRSEAFKLTINKPLTNYIKGLASGAPEDFKKFSFNLWLNLFPETTQNLEEFAFQFGLFPTQNELFQRRNLSAAWKSTGGQGLSYFQSQIDEAGFDVTIHSPIDQSTGNYIDPFSILPGEANTGAIQCASAGAFCAGENAYCSQLQGAIQRHLVNQDLTGEPQPPISDDPATFENWIYVSSEDISQPATIPANRNLEFQNLLLSILPGTDWIGYLIDEAETTLQASAQNQALTNGGLNVSSSAIGKTIIIYRRANNKGLYASVFDSLSGKIFQEFELVGTSDDVTEASVAFFSDGDAIACWTLRPVPGDNIGTVFYSIFNASSDTWTQPSPVPGGDESGPPTVATDGLNKSHLIFRRTVATDTGSRREATQIIYDKNTGLFSAPHVYPMDDDQGGEVFTVAIDSNLGGVFVSSWTEINNSTFRSDVKAAVYDPAADAFGEVISLGESDFGALDLFSDLGAVPSVNVDFFGNAYVLHRALRSGASGTFDSAAILASRYDASSKKWLKFDGNNYKIILTPDPSTDDFYSQIKSVLADDGSVFFISQFSASPEGLQTGKLNQSLQLSELVKFNRDGLSSSRLSDIAVSKSGQITIAECRDSKTFTITRTGPASWLDPKEISLQGTSQTIEPVLSSSSSNQIFLAWYQNQIGESFTVCYFSVLS